MELENYKIVVFDLGGTLMEYEGMPLNWNDYYYQGTDHRRYLSHIIRGIPAGIMR